MKAYLVFMACFLVIDVVFCLRQLKRARRRDQVQERFVDELECEKIKLECKLDLAEAEVAEQRRQTASVRSVLTQEIERLAHSIEERDARIVALDAALAVARLPRVETVIPLIPSWPAANGYRCSGCWTWVHGWHNCVSWSRITAPGYIGGDVTTTKSCLCIGSCTCFKVTSGSTPYVEKF